MAAWLPLYGYQASLDCRLPTSANLTASHSSAGASYVATRPEAVGSLSASIAIARVICICGIVYVHAWTGLDVDELRAQGGSWHSILYWALIELLGRSSVPLLSIVSGWLVMASVSKRSYAGFAAGKARGLLLPMVLWNLITMVVLAALVRFAGLNVPQAAPGLPLLNELFHLTAPGQINVQNAFLRDVFVCMLAAPLLGRLPNAALGVILAVTVAWCVEGWQLFILLRPQILLFFLIGIFAFRFRWEAFVNRLPMLPLTLVYLLLGTMKVWLSIRGQGYQYSHPEMVAIFDNFLRIMAAMFFWKLARLLARSSLSDMMQYGERYAFLLFCSHILLIWLLAPLVGPMFGRFGEPGYPLFLLLQPVMAMAAAIALGQLLLLLHFGTAKILSGGRLAQGVRRA